MTFRVAVVADDLTSAGDGAAPFRAAGIPTHIVLDGAVRLAGTGVLAVDTDSRAVPELEAAERVAATVAVLSGADLLIKTIDSTARGHLRAELQAALAASGRTVAVVAPAFPAAGRTTSAGVQLVDGTPVHLTAFAADPDHPVRTSDLIALLPGSALHPVGEARLPDAQVVVADAGTDADLDAIVAAVSSPREVLWVGSPGLSAALARAYRGDVTDPNVPLVAGQEPPRRTVVVVGTRHPAGRVQLDRLAAAGTPSVNVDVPGAPAEASTALERCGAVALHGPQGEAPGAGAVLGRIAQATASLHATAPLDGLVLTGGASARAVLTAMGVHRLELLGEPEPGITLARAPTAGPWVVLKAGGFGDPNILCRLQRPPPARLIPARPIQGHRPPRQP